MRSAAACATMDAPPRGGTAVEVCGVTGMHPEEGPVAAVAATLRERLGDAPPTAIVLGSGLGLVVDRMDVDQAVLYADLGLPRSTVRGHAGKVVVGRLAGTPVAVFSGRVHRYEGYSADQIVRYVRAGHRWGLSRLVLTCASGGIAEGLEPGEVALLSDHINLQYDNPLMGESFAGPRFPDMTCAHDAHMRQTLHAAARDAGITLHDGVYASVTGPAYETPAETRMLARIGADMVGMSTVPEILAAAQVGMPVAAVALISNRAAGLTPEPLSHAEVTDVAHRAGVQLAALLEAAVGRF